MLMKWKFTQTTGERKRYTLDYSDWLDTGELVSTVTYAVTPVTASPVVVNGTSTTDSGGIFYMSGGLVDRRYEILITMTSSQGQIKQDEVTLHIVNL